MNRFIILTIFLLAFGASAFSQNSEDQLHHTYYYTVDHVDSEQQLQEVYSTIENLKFVSKVKLNYKPEKSGSAQYIIYVVEPKRTSETQVMFQPTDLKQIIVESNLNITDLKIYEN